MATSPRKSPTPRKSMTPRPTKPRKSVKTSAKGSNSKKVADDSTREAEKQPKTRKPIGRKPIKATDSSEKRVNQGGSSATALKGSCAFAFDLQLNEVPRMLRRALRAKSRLITLKVRETG